ncbi:MAG: LuxR C-terminal-related transcriptional regulator [Dehalococcoidia bacterium]
MTTPNTLDQGRDSFRRQVWGEAYAQLLAADGEKPLPVDDLDRLAISAYLTGREDDCVSFWTREHNECLQAGDPTRAARCAFWLAFSLLLNGEMAQGGGWLSRAHRLLEDYPECVEQGYLLVPKALQSMGEGNFQVAVATFNQAVDFGERFHDPDLLAIGRLGRGQALIHLGEGREGIALLDEAMTAVTAGEVSPIAAGIVYCALIEACQEIFDLRRAQEWTAALSHWCDSQPDLVLYRGQCLVHRAEILQLRGNWIDSMNEATRALERLSQPPNQPAVGMAFYQQAELHRLRGEFTQAEAAYRRASQQGREPVPGLAQLRLAQGRTDAAAAAIRRLVDETQDRVAQSKLCAAYVEIMLAAGDVPAARTAADGLSETAANLDAPLLNAISAHATGAVLLFEGQVTAALPVLRRAWTAWQDLQVPYEAARVRVLVGLACRELGDEDTAEMELDAARLVFQQLGAAPDLVRVEALSGKAAAPTVGGLTSREVQVLRLLAEGKTNRTIADDLVISEKTVARHVSNIFSKLGISSRSSATAYAYEHELL